MFFRNYLSRLRQAIEKFNSYGFSESIEIREEFRAGKQASIFAKIVLVDSSTLILKEYIDAKYKIKKISYAYQYQAENGQLIFRYDNALHKPKLEYSEHKHTANGEIEEWPPPDIMELVDEVIKLL